MPQGVSRQQRERGHRLGGLRVRAPFLGSWKGAGSLGFRVALLCVEGPVASAMHASARRGPCRWPRVLGEPASGVTSARLAAGPLLLVSGSCCHPRPGHRVAQEQFSPRRSLPLPPCDPDFLQPGFQTREGYGGDRGPASGEAQGTATAAPDSPSPSLDLGPSGCPHTPVLPGSDPKAGRWEHRPTCSGSHLQPAQRQLPPDRAWGALISRTDPGGEGQLALTVQVRPRKPVNFFLRSF